MRRGATARPVARAGSLLRAHLANYRYAAAELGAVWQRAGHFMFVADYDVLVRGGASSRCADATLDVDLVLDVSVALAVGVFVVDTVLEEYVALAVGVHVVDTVLDALLVALVVDTVLDALLVALVVDTVLDTDVALVVGVLSTMLVSHRGV